MASSDTLILSTLGVVSVLCTGVLVAQIIHAVSGWKTLSTNRHFEREQLDLGRDSSVGSLDHMLFALITRVLSAIPSTNRRRLVALWHKFDPRKRQRARLFAQQLPDALDQIAQALGAGLSLPQAIDRASQYLPDPIGSELHGVYSHMMISHSFEQSFDLLRDEYEGKELALVCSGIAVQSRLGGNMKEMLQRTARYCRQSHALERSLRAQTAQSRLSL
ncbi:MAG: type II secretion system F family protein, partial [Actinomycetia bacterium]|nr:type II secretion system F family protein [Actinomycetes bacterium]